jgi:acyl carrier protein
VVLDELPLTPNGKLDRAALPAPEGRPELDAVYQAPRTPAEEVLAEIWCEVLELERVGIHDNFFELGGHSLVATQVVSRVRDAFLVELPLRALFESPTVAALETVVKRMLLEEVEALSESDASAALHSMSSGRDEQRELA